MMFSAIAGPHPRAPPVTTRTRLDLRCAARPGLQRLPDRLEPDPRRPARRPPGGCRTRGGDSGRLRTSGARSSLPTRISAASTKPIWRYVAGRWSPVRGENYKHRRDQLKKTIHWNVEYGLNLSVADIASAEQVRSQVFQRMYDFFQDYDFLICPVNQVPPFDCRDRISNGDRQRRDGELHILDEVGLLHQLHRPALDLRPGRLHRRRPTAADRPPDRRPLASGPGDPPDRPRLRGGNGTLEYTTAGDFLAPDGSILGTRNDPGDHSGEIVILSAHENRVTSSSSTSEASSHSSPL